ncbi:hypothetical protein FDECE_2488, partial [Fusarium decemcellulare]
MISPSDRPTNATRYFVKSNDMQYLCGRITGIAGDGEFLDPGESVHHPPLVKGYGEQPAYFQPRVDWSHWNPSTFPRYNTSADVESVAEITGSVTDRPNWHLPCENSLYWSQHCANLVPGLYAMQQGKKLSGMFLASLTRMVCYEIEDLVTVAPGFLSIGRNVRSTSPEPQSPLLDSTNDQEICDITLGYDDLSDWRKDVHGKRFFAGLAFHRQTEHWTSFIWDRVRGQLLIYDSSSDSSKIVGHARATVLAWRQFLAHAGLPYNFDYYALPLTPQREAQQAGLLAAAALFNALRGLVGLTCEDLGKTIPSTRLLIDGSSHPPKQGFELLHRDWFLQPWLPRTRANCDLALRCVRTLFSVAILEEMGVQDGQIVKDNGQMTEQDAEIIDVKMIEYSDRTTADQLMNVKPHPISGIDLVTWTPITKSLIHEGVHSTYTE